MRKLIVLLGCVTVMAASSASVLGDSAVIQPTAVQDAESIPQVGLPVNPVDGLSPMLRFGSWSSASIDAISIMTLPAIAPGDLISATLRVPKPDSLQSGGTNGLDELIILEHIDAFNDALVTGNDYHTSSPALSQIAVYHDGPGGQLPCPDGSCIETYDVTAQVLADLNAGRLSFAARTQSLGTDGQGAFPG